jgi:hypothetical protein
MMCIHVYAARVSVQDVLCFTTLLDADVKDVKDTSLSLLRGKVQWAHMCCGDTGELGYGSGLP